LRRGDICFDFPKEGQRPVLTIIYRPPGQSLQLFNQELSELLQILIQKVKFS